MRFHEKRMKPHRRPRRRKREQDRLERLHARARRPEPTAPAKYVYVTFAASNTNQEKS